MKRRKTLFDVYSEEACWLWLRLTQDFEVERCEGLDYIGHAPEWLEDEASAVGWEAILGLPHGDWPQRVWALENGLAPGQCFRVRVGLPAYSQHWTDCGYEYDVGFEAEVVQRLPLPPETLARAWEVALWEQLEAEGAAQRRKEAQERECQAVEARARVDAGALYLQRECYYARGDTLDCPPSGVRFWLRSAHGPTTLASGESDTSDADAMERLLASVEETLPHLRAEAIRTLPWGQPRRGGRPAPHQEPTMSPMEAMSRCGVSHSASVKPGRPADTLRCRYADCAEAHPEAAEDEQVTCTACRTELGLPV